MSLSRRKFFNKLGQGAVAGVIGANVLASETCKFLKTPDQPLGPFYPLQLPSDTNIDLTQVEGNTRSAFGERVLITGVVQDKNCKPIEGAIVEVWQACESGKYNHPSDTSPNKLDPNFQYYAQVITNSKGEYSFKTIIPGEYDASASWRRPPHIHFKVSLRGYEELVTQLYFKGEKLNDFDRILQSLNKDEQNEVVVEFKQANASHTIKKGIFNIKLEELS